jgi:VanZ family protein
VIALPGASALKPFRWPRLWLGLWWLAIALVALGSLLPAMLLPVVPEGGDKFEHLLGYGLLAAIAVQVFATRAALLRAALGLVLLGVVLELAQGLFTATRAMDPMDALANTLGVALGMATALMPVRNWLLRAERAGVEQVR